jgi:rhomboid protease GluP
MHKSPTAGSPLVYRVEYNQYSSAIYNLDFKDAGELTIPADGSAFIFTGTPRGWMTGGEKRELVFTPADIANVGILGHTVQFKTKRGRSGEKGRPFAFHLGSTEEAATVARLLPTTLDDEFTGHRDFATKLAAMPAARHPWTSVTNVIVALNCVAFVLMGLAGAGWFETASLMPYVRYGANNGAATTDGEWWRLLTSLFLHYGLMHVLFNMWALFETGHIVERLLGRASYLLMYLAAGIAGGLASIGWNGDEKWSAGASGAVFGVYGALLGYMVRERETVPKVVFKSILRSTSVFVLYNVAIGLASPRIDNAAHLGGLAGGFAFSCLLALPLNVAARRQRVGGRLVLGLAALGALVVAGIAFTPRFDYRVSEVVAWHDLNRNFFEQESNVLKRQRAEFATAHDPAAESAHADWLEREAIPFYQNWRDQLSGLMLAPEKATAKTRDRALRIIDLRLASYRRLAAGFRRHDPAARAGFEADSARIAEELARTKEGKN